MWLCTFSHTSAAYDYKATAITLVFEPSDGMGSQQQCLEIEIINDSLPEDLEVFTLLLSTNNLGVYLSTHRVDVYIQPNNGIYKCLLFIASYCWILVKYVV